MSELFGNNLTFLRERNNLKQSQMIDFTGVSRATWSDYERGKTEPDFKGLIKISDFFGVSVDEILKIDLSNKKPDVNLNSIQEDGENIKNVNLNVYPSVNLKGKKEDNRQLSDLLRELKNKDKIINGLLLAVNSMEATNSRLLEDIKRITDENNRLKKEIPQIGQEMGGANTQTA